MNKKNQGFRWIYYFRHGWANYFAFIITGISTLVTTYFLAIEKIPILREVFPSFTNYSIIIGCITAILLISIGYWHWKKSNAIKAEMDITYEENPYMMRIIMNSELMLKINFKLIEMIKILERKDSIDNQIDVLKKLQSDILQIKNNRDFRNWYDDWKEFKKSN